MTDSTLGLASLFNMSDDLVERVSGAQERWGSVPAVVQYREDRLPSVKANEMWSKIYRRFGASGEKFQDEVFMAVNMYFCINGCSPSGKYARPIRTASGIEVPSSDVTKVTGRLKGEIRQFLRGRLRDSYDALKYSQALQNDEAALARAEQEGIPRHLVHLLADWFKGCEFLTAEEEDIYAKASARAIQRAALRRAQDKVMGTGERGATQIEEVPVPETYQSPTMAPVTHTSY